MITRNLSVREKEVYLLIAKGLAPREIAEKLGLSVKTVSTYRARVLEKTGLRSNAAIAVDAERRGLLNEDKTNEHSSIEANGSAGAADRSDPGGSDQIDGSAET